MKIGEYLEAIGLSRRTFAKLIGVNSSLIDAAVNGNHSLSAFNALLIEEATNGDVTIMELCSAEERKKINKVKKPFKKIGKKPQTESGE